MGRKKVKCEEGITVPNPVPGLWRDPMEVFPLRASQIWRKRENDPTGAVHLTGATVSEVLYKKYLHDPDNHDGVITYLEPTSWNVKSSGP